MASLHAFYFAVVEAAHTQFVPTCCVFFSLYSFSCTILLTIYSDYRSENNGSLNYTFFLWSNIRECHTAGMNKLSLSLDLSHLSQMLMSKNCPLNRNKKCKCDIIHFWCILRVHSRVIYAVEKLLACTGKRARIWITNKELIHSSMNIRIDESDSIYYFFTGSSCVHTRKTLAIVCKKAKESGVDVKCDRQGPAVCCTS